MTKVFITSICTLSMLFVLACGGEQELTQTGETLRPEVAQLLAARQERLTGLPAVATRVQARQNVVALAPNVTAEIGDGFVSGSVLPQPQHLGASGFSRTEISAPNPAAGFFGHKSTAGDFNCDGITDVAVSQNGWTGDLGRVLIYFGSASGLPSTPSITITGTVAQARFGFSLATLDGDNDANSCDDLAIHSYGEDASRGRVFLYLGRTTWSNRTDFTANVGADLYFTPNILTSSATERMGWGLTGADMNGDGHDDLVFGHFNATSGGFAQILVIFGRSNVPVMGNGSSPKPLTMPGAADLMITGGSYDHSFGQVIENGGRLDSDVYEDIIIGAYTDAPPNYDGAVYVVEGAADAIGSQPVSLAIGSSSRVNKITATSAGNGFGFDVAGVGDFNNDGTNEFLVSEPYHTSGSDTSMGKVYVFEFDVTPKPTDETDAAFTIDNNNVSPASDLFGRGPANGADISGVDGCDLNNDGFSDIVFGANNTGAGNYGSVYVFMGRSGALSNLTATGASYTWSGASGDTSFGLSNTFANDANNDTYPDVIVSEAYYNSNVGRFWFYY